MLALLTEGDALSRLVALALFLMSVASWSLILWKTGLLWRSRRGLARSIAAFWQSASLQDADERLQTFDRARLVLPLLRAAQDARIGQGPQGGATLGGRGQATVHLTRLMRDALQGVTQRLQHGQILLASVGATAPFVGLLGTVWSIYQALGGLGGSGQIRLEQISGPVGEALVMTAAGLAVAIPAVLAYNVLGRQIQQLEAELEGFAQDLRELLLEDGA
jgi:biopolymer transport protein ExbB